MDALQAWRLGPESSSALEMLGPGGPAGLEALQARKPCGPVTTTHGLDYSFWVDQKVVSIFFLTYSCFFCV